MKKCLVSIIMSVHNGEAYLQESIQSVLRQEHNNFEFIIIDDGSTDTSLEIIKGYASQDKRIKLLINQTNLGLTKSLNLGLEKAKGDYIARQDVGDISLPRRISRQVNFLGENREYFLCASNVEYLDASGRRLEGQLTFDLPPDKIQTALEKKNYFAHSTIMFRNEGYRYREKFRYAQDYDLYLRLLSEGKKLVLLPEVLVRYRISDLSITSGKSVQQALFARQAKIFYLERKKFGQDSYDQWDEKEISSLADKDVGAASLERLIEYSLQTGGTQSLPKLLDLYRREKQGSFFKYIFYHLFLNLPIAYLIYRRVRYGKI